MNNWKKVLGVGVAIGLLLVLVQYVFRFDTKIFQTTVLLLCIALFVIISLTKTLSTSHFRKRVQKELALMEAGKPEEALQDMEALAEELDQKKNQHQAALCRLNMTAAYREMKRYDKALEVLESLSGEKFEGLEDVVYRLNLCICNFYLGDNEKGLSIYQENEKLFDEYDHHKRYGVYITLAMLFATVAAGELDKAEQRLERAKAVYCDARYEEDFRMVEDRLTAARANALPEQTEESAE